MLQGLREESILEPFNLACLKPLHYLEYPATLFASVHRNFKSGVAEGEIKEKEEPEKIEAGQVS